MLFHAAQAIHQRQAHQQVEQGDQGVDGHVLEGRRGDQLALSGHLGHGDGRHQGRVLEHHHQGVAVGRQSDAKRLWQDHPAHHQRRAHPQGFGSFALALFDGNDAGTEVLGLVRRVGDAHADHTRIERGEVYAHVGQYEVDVEQLHNDWQATDHVDDGAGRPRQCTNRRQLEQRQYQPERTAEQERQHGDLDRHPGALQQDRQEVQGVLQELSRLHGRTWVSSPHFLRMLSRVPSALMLAMAVFRRSRVCASPLRTTRQTSPTLLGV